MRALELALELARGRVADWWAASLRRRVQLAVLGLVAVLSMGMAVIAWAATELAADSFINQALERRAQDLRQHLSQGVPLAQLAAQDSRPAYHFYSSAQAGLPAVLQQLSEEGVHELSEIDAHVLVLEHPAPEGGRREQVFLLYRPELDSELAAYDRAIRVHLLLMLAGAALLGLFMAWRLGRWTAAPIEALTAQVQAQTQGLAPMRSPVLERPDEMGRLSHSFARAYQDLADYARRERDFTRFASHELRTPLSVIQGAAELMRLAPNRERMLAPLQRVQEAGARMQALIELFLLLAREQQGPAADHEPLLQGLRACLQELPAATTTAPHVQWPADGAEDWRELEQLCLPRALGRMALGNLLRNAWLHGDGRICITMRERRLQLSNGRSASAAIRHAGAPPEPGHGHGLDIVAAIAERLAWRLSTEVQAERYRVEIEFPGGAGPAAGAPASAAAEPCFPNHANPASPANPANPASPATVPPDTAGLTATAPERTL